MTGKLLNQTVIYPDFTLEKTREWWTDALQRFVITDQKIKFDGIFLVMIFSFEVFQIPNYLIPNYQDYLTPVNEQLNKTCSNNKWNFPAYMPSNYYFK